MTVTTLASGSAGNCTLVSEGDTHLLIDAGLSCRKITTALNQLGLSPDDLTAICVTHEHSDHISGLGTLTKRHRIPLYATEGTGRGLCARIPSAEALLRPLSSSGCCSIGVITVESFPTLHDTQEPCGFALSAGEKKAAIVTDLGRVTEDVRRGIAGAQVVLVELNHDRGCLNSGPYPPYLKERIAGDWGHLSNEDGAALARYAAERGTHTLVLAHLSAENNSPRLARAAAERALYGWEGTLLVASQQEMGGTLVC